MQNINYIFHHIPKCGGSSLNEGFKNWFDVIKDYRASHTSEFPPSYDLDTLSNKQLLSGHFDLKGNHLNDRYPGALDNENIRVLSFIREPLQVRLSLNRFEKLIGTPTQLSIEDDLALPYRKNWISKRFPVTENNYREILDKYFFIGVLEQFQFCIDLLARKINQPTFNVPWLNVTEEDNTILNPIEIEKFKTDNALDYMIYDYCIKRLQNE